MSIDWDLAFSQLKMWPVTGCNDEIIAKQTPRATYQLWQQLNEWRVAFAGMAKEAEKVQPVAYPQRVDPEPQEPPLPSSEPPKSRGWQAVKGLGIENHEAFKEYPGEDEYDPFSLPREIAKQRWEILVIQLAGFGQLTHLGVPKGNIEAARDFFVKSWDENTKIFEDIKRSMEEPEEKGQAMIWEMAREGRLRNYQVQPDADDETVMLLFRHLQECYRRWKEKQ